MSRTGEFIIAYCLYYLINCHEIYFIFQLEWRVEAAGRRYRRLFCWRVFIVIIYEFIIICFFFSIYRGDVQTWIDI